MLLHGFSNRPDHADVVYIVLLIEVQLHIFSCGHHEAALALTKNPLSSVETPSLPSIGIEFLHHIIVEYLIDLRYYLIDVFKWTFAKQISALGANLQDLAIYVRMENCRVLR